MNGAALSFWATPSYPKVVSPFMDLLAYPNQGEGELASSPACRSHAFHGGVSWSQG